MDRIAQMKIVRHNSTILYDKCWFGIPRQGLVASVREYTGSIARVTTYYAQVARYHDKSYRAMFYGGIIRAHIAWAGSSARGRWTIKQSNIVRRAPYEVKRRRRSSSDHLGHSVWAKSRERPDLCDAVIAIMTGEWLVHTVTWWSALLVFRVAAWLIARGSAATIVAMSKCPGAMRGYVYSAIIR